MIKEVKKYTDDDGRSVTAYIPIDNPTKIMPFKVDCSEDLIAYEGQVGIPTPMGVASVRFPFPENFTLEQCFEKFMEIAEIEVERIMKEAEEKAKDDNLIITPGQAAQQGNSIPFPVR